MVSRSYKRSPRSAAVGQLFWGAYWGCLLRSRDNSELSWWRFAPECARLLVVGPLEPTEGKGRRSRAGYRLSPTSGQRETKKRWPPVPLPNSLFVHLRRWRRLGEHMWSNETTKDVDRAFRAVARSAGLPWATPHVIRPIASHAREHR